MNQNRTEYFLSKANLNVSIILRKPKKIINLN